MLFLVTMFSALMIKIPRVPGVVALLVGCIGVQFIKTDVLGLGLFKWYLPFFAAGVILAPSVVSGSWRALKKWWVPLLSALVYVAFTYGWARVGPEPLAIAWQASGLPFAKAIGLAYRYAAAGAGIMASLSVVVFLPLDSFIARSLRYLGRRTLEIYVGHQFFLPPFQGVGLIWVPVAAAVSCACALLVANILKRVVLLRWLLYGGRN